MHGCGSEGPRFVPQSGRFFFHLNFFKEEINQKLNKKNNNNSSNSLVYGRWPQTKILARSRWQEKSQKNFLPKSPRQVSPLGVTKHWCSSCRRTYPELASTLLHPEGQRPVHRLQEGADVRKRHGRPAEQLHRQELPDPTLRPAEALRVHCPRPPDDHRCGEDVLCYQ